MGIGGEDVDVGPEKMFVPVGLLDTKLPLIRAGAFNKLTEVRAMWNPHESAAPRDQKRYDTAVAVLQRWHDVYEFAATGQLRLFHNLAAHSHGTSGICGKPRVPQNLHDALLHELFAKLQYGSATKLTGTTEQYDRIDDSLLRDAAGID